MGFINGLNRLISIYYQSLKNLGKPKIFFPFFVLFVLQLLILVSLKNYVNPCIYPILKPFVALGGNIQSELFCHYPGLYLLLSYFFQFGRLIPGILFEGLIYGITTVMFLKIYSSSKYPDLNLSYALKKWHHLLICWVLISGLLFAINYFLPQWFQGILYGSPKRQMAFDIGLQLLIVGVFSIFIYAIPSVIVFKNNFLSAIKTSFSYFWKYPFFSFFLALIAFLFTFPFSFLTGKSDLIITKFSPELILYIILIGLFIEMIVNIILAGALAKFLDEENR